MMKSRYDCKQCDDPAGWKEMWNVLRWMKYKAVEEESMLFKDAFAVLDEAFGPEMWRVKQGKALILCVHW
jgi:hypothetical protein